MKIETYKRYAPIFDRFSHVELFPQSKDFINKALDYIKSNGRVCDVGGGTGYYTNLLFDRYPSLALTFVEPSNDMISQAKTRLPASTHYIEKKINDSLNEIEKQDVFIFQRSLYSFFDHIDSYVELAKEIYAKTNKNGCVAIYELNGVYDIKEVYAYYGLNCNKIGLSKDEFNLQWPIMENILEEYNFYIERGDFTVMTKKVLCDVFGNAGFVLDFQKDSSYFFQKKYTS